MAEGGKVSETLLEVRNLSKNFGAVQALADLSMKVSAGEVVALAGDNGAGKTTLIKAISGVYKPSGGDILLRGGGTMDALPEVIALTAFGLICYAAASALYPRIAQ